MVVDSCGRSGSPTSCWSSRKPLMCRVAPSMPERDFYFLFFCWWNVDVSVESRSFALNMLLFFFKRLIELLKQLDSQGQSRDSNSYWSHILENITDGQLSYWQTHTHTLRLESKAHQCYVMIMWFHFFEEVPQQLAETHLINTEHISTKNMTDVLQLAKFPVVAAEVRSGEAVCAFTSLHVPHIDGQCWGEGKLWRWWRHLEKIFSVSRVYPKFN